MRRGDRRKPVALVLVAATGLAVGVALGSSDASAQSLADSAGQPARLAAAGGSWAPLGPPATGGLSSFAVSRESARWMVAANLAGTSLYATQDGGADWVTLPVPPAGADPNAFALQVAVDPLAPATVYVVVAVFSLGGKSVNALFRSADGGASWVTLPVPSGPTWMAIDPQDDRILYAGPPAARSADAGATWTQLSGLPAQVTQMVIDPVSPGNVYALASFSPDLYKSSDRGVTWTLAGSTIGDLTALAVDPAHASTLYAAAGGYLEKSIDGGATWQIVYSPSDPVHQGVNAVTVAPTLPTTIYALRTGQEVVASADGGVTWSPLPQANLTGVIVGLQVDPQNPRRLIANVAQAGLAATTVPGPCTAGTEALCLGTGGRFLVSATWQTAQAEGAGKTAALTADTGAFWFFDAANVELLVKVLDGCGVNQQHWVFAAGLTNVGVTVTVTDTQTGEAKSYTNPSGVPFPPLQDTAAFGSCP